MSGLSVSPSDGYMARVYRDEERVAVELQSPQERVALFMNPEDALRLGCALIAEAARAGEAARGN